LRAETSSAKQIYSTLIIPQASKSSTVKMSVLRTQEAPDHKTLSSDWTPAVGADKIVIGNRMDFLCVE
jgi:hypothetical protein